MNMNKYLYMFKNTFKTGGDFFSDFLNSNANIKTIQLFGLPLHLSIL